MKKQLRVLIMILAILVLIVGGYSLFFNKNWSLNSCVDECEHRGYNYGDCLWPTESAADFVNIGPCLIKDSRHCGNEEQCNCYCYNGQLIGGCGAVHPDYIQECCENLAEENNIVHIQCVGEWEVKDGKCGWKCSV